jgi:hypothetical protein
MVESVTATVTAAARRVTRMSGPAAKLIAEVSHVVWNADAITIDPHMIHNDAQTCFMTP